MTVQTKSGDLRDLLAGLLSVVGFVAVIYGAYRFGAYMWDYHRELAVAALPLLVGWWLMTLARDVGTD